MRRNEFTYSSRDLMQLLVFSLVVVLGPLLLYPYAFGIDFTMSLTSLLLVEGIYYLIVFSIVNSGSGLLATLLGATIALAYRIALSALYGVMIFAPGAEQWDSAFAMGLNGYWPAFGLFVVCSPFVTMSLVKWVIDRLDSREAPLTSGSVSQRGFGASDTQSIPSHQSDEAVLRGTKPVSAHVSASPSAYDGDGAENRETVAPEEFAFGTDTEREQHDRSNGFERGVRYLAEHAAVRVATVVDRDGFQLAGFGRLGFDSASWAPMALTIIESNSATLMRFGAAQPTKVELEYDNLRIDCRCVGRFYLLVVSERNADELLGVRVSQASEMINKYVSVRYSERVTSALNSLEANMEESNVRSA